MLLDNPLNPDPRVWREAITLKEFGYDVTIFCQQGDGLPDFEEIEGVRIRRVFRYKLGTSVLVDKYLTAHFQLKEALDQEGRFDVYHCHDVETWPLGYILAKENHSLWVADAHEYFPDDLFRENYPDEHKYQTAKLLAKNRGQYIREADGVITVSHDIAEALKEEFQLECPIAAVYNTRLEKHEVTADKAKFRERFGFGPGERILVFAGILRKDRGIPNLIELIGKLPENYKLLIIGDGFHAKYAAEMQRTNSRVMYLGQLPYQEMINYVYASDAYVYFRDIALTQGIKNYHFQMPNKFFDAIFSGIPFFAYKGSSTDQYIEKFNIGKCFDPDDSFEQIAECIHRDLENGEFLNGFYADAKDYFSWKRQRDRLGALYDQLLH